MLNKIAKYVNENFFLNKIILIYLFTALCSSIAALAPLYLLPLVKTSIFILVLRDFLMFIVLSMLFFLNTKLIYKLMTLLLLLLISIFAVIGSQNLLMTVFGLKSIVPLFLLFAVSDKKKILLVDKKFLEKTLIFLFLMNLTLQFSHAFFGYGYYAKFGFGMNARNPGLYFFPAATAFLVSVIFYIFSTLKPTIKLGELLLYITSTALSASISGLASAFVILFLIRKKLRKLYLVGACFLLILMTYYIHLARLAMTGSVYLSETGGGRIKVFAGIAHHLETHFNFNVLTIHNFGLYTNAAVNYVHGYVPDSLYASFIGNLGTVWSMILILFFSVAVWTEYKTSKKMNPIYILILTSSFGLNITESGISIFLCLLSKHIQPSEVES